ncbi:MAG: pyridoxamine 5'-phosphate oxidase family protein [Desulfobacteraceae bacterium]|nr:MAG: pyridoxamine 5'-phosphate oxidase family protein [Desulfobacteraceae bacterium]
MRRNDRLITHSESFSILENGQFGTLSTASCDGEPYGVPLNYCLIDNCIYFHCALEGRKINNIAANPKVSFCVVGRTEVLPDKFSTKYESCIVQGFAYESFGEEKQKALEGIVRKYSVDFASEGFEFIEKYKDKTRVFKITIETISGKARR